MINQASCAAAAEACAGDQVTPLYQSYCFSNIPRFMLDHFGVSRGPEPDSAALPSSVGSELFAEAEQVVFFLFDGFGWQFFEQFVEQSPALRRFAADGVVSKLTAQFPSTTAAEITTIHTALPVGIHGIYEWFYYEPLVDGVISPFLYSWAGEEKKNTLKELGLLPEQIFPTSSIYQLLEQALVRPVVYHPAGFCNSPYDQAVTRGAQLVGYKHLPAGLTRLVEDVRNNQGRSYRYFYYGNIDNVFHEHGPDSRCGRAEVKLVLDTWQKLFWDRIAGQSSKTVIVATADHGSVQVAPEKTIYLDRLLPNLADKLIRNRSGKLIVPAGGPRDFFLHVKEEAKHEAREMLQNQLNGAADVFLVDQLIDQGMFGANPVSDNFLSRAGNIVILARENQMIWWWDQGQFEKKHRGHHGGLSKPEMEIPFMVLRAD